MKIKTILWPVLGLIFLFSIANEEQGQVRRSIRVTGRAVDRNGAVVSNVLATLYSPPCRGCIDNVVPSNRSFDDGVFFVDSTGTLRDQFTLYLEEIEPPGFWSPIGAAPYYKLAHLPEFRGIPIKPSRQSSDIQLGDVEVKIRFGKVILEVPENWKELAPESTPLFLRLRDRTGALIYDGKLPLTTANASSDSVKLALTPGRWKVQLMMRHHNQELSSPVKSVNVQPGSCALLPATRLAAAQPCPA